MNSGEHSSTAGDEYMQSDGQNSNRQALTDLRARLSDGLARIGLNKSVLARGAGLGRTTVSEAFLDDGRVPSAITVAALARALKLPVEELLELRRLAAAEPGGDTADAAGLGRPIDEWDPHSLEVHPAGPIDGGTPGQWLLPGYVSRKHDQFLRAAVEDAAQGRSRMLVLVGTSSTGKTRACWEAVQPLAGAGWRLWHPFDPTRAEAALDDLHRVRPRTVVWLNEAQHYLGGRETGERIAATLHGLLTTPERGPVLVLGTLWPEYSARYTALPSPDGDPYSRVRELLSGRMLSVPDTFDAQALATATARARDGDRLLADALTRAGASGRVAQDLAGAPELLNRYKQVTPAARALLEAAMDAHRLGVGLHLPQPFLTAAAADYLTDTDYDQLTNDWTEQAYAELAEPVHGKQAPLASTTYRPRLRPPTPSPPADPAPPAASGPMLRLADYLAQHGHTTRRPLCPPASFWHAALTHLTRPDDLHSLAEAAETRHRLQWAHCLWHNAADRGSPDALFHLAVLREKAGDRESAEDLYQRAAGHGSSDALWNLASMRHKAGDRESAEDLYRQAETREGIDARWSLSTEREDEGDWERPDSLIRQCADGSDPSALWHLAVLRERAGDRESAENFARKAADCGSPDALWNLARMREEAGDRESADNLARQATRHGHHDALYSLAELREEAGDWESAETLYQQAATDGHPYALYRLAARREEAGDWKGAEELLRQAADDDGDANIVYHMARMREQAGDRGGAENLVRQCADDGDPSALYRLAVLREEAGDRESAETLYQQAAGHGSTDALCRLAELREEAGDRASAEDLYRQAANSGTHNPWERGNSVQIFATRWPDGLEPDGTPTQPWQ